MPAAPSAPPPVAAPKAAPAPTPKAAPAPTAKPELSAPAETSDPFNDAFADIDSIETGKPKVQPKKESAPKKESTPAEEEDATGVDSTSADGSSSEQDKDGSAKAATKPEEQKPFKAAELRNAYDGLKKKVKEEYEPKLKRLTELESRVKQYETKNPEAEKAAQEKVSAIEKENQELQAAIRVANYKKSKEYKEHEEKYNEAWASAGRKLKGIKITKHSESGEVVERALAMDDLLAYGRMEPDNRWSELRSDIPDPAERTAVINHIDKIVELAGAMDAAEKKADDDAKVHAETHQKQQEEFQKNRERFWSESNETWANRYPQWFSKTEGDEDGNSQFDKGIALADLAFAPHTLTQDQISLLPAAFREQIEAKKPFTQKQLVNLHSIIRSKAANHDRLVHQNKSLKARVAELEKSLKEFEESSPDNVRAGVVNGIKSDGMDVNAELDALDRKGR